MILGKSARIHAVDTIRFSEQQKMILDSARSFCEDSSPIEKVRQLIESSQGFEDRVWKQIVELGWIGITAPEDFGGSQLGIESLVPIVESMGRSLMSTPFISCNIALQLLMRAASLEQQQRWLPKLLEGQIAAIAVLDNEDWGAKATTHHLTDTMELRGEKWFVDDASTADLFFVYTQFRGAPRFVAVSKDQLSKHSVQEHGLIDETKRASKVDFTGVFVSEADILVAENAEEILREVELIGALLTAAEAVGATSSCLNLTVEYLNTRKQFGRLIGSYQALKHPCTDILIKLEGARSQVYHAATLFENFEAENTKIDRDLEIACRMAKAASNDALLLAGDRAVQFHGGMGFTYECDAQLYLRRAQWSQQKFGDSAHHRKRLAPLLLS